jgi:hypothetical protein
MSSFIDGAHAQPDAQGMPLHEPVRTGEQHSSFDDPQRPRPSGIVVHPMSEQVPPIRAHVVVGTDESLGRIGMQQLLGPSDPHLSVSSTSNPLEHAADAHVPPLSVHVSPMPRLQDGLPPKLHPE